MTKEAGAGVKPKTTKTQKDDKCHQEDRQANSNPKRDGSSRIPLEGKPGKRQKECKEMETNNMQELKNDETNKESELETSTGTPTQQEDNYHNSPTKDEEEQPTVTSSLLQELREIKNTILNLDTKIESSYQDLFSRITDNTEMKELLASQNDKIAMLYNENKELKLLNNKLKKEIIEMQGEALHLKVDITGIPESSYGTYEQL